MTISDLSSYQMVAAQLSQLGTNTTANSLTEITEDASSILGSTENVDFSDVLQNVMNGVISSDTTNTTDTDTTESEEATTMLQLYQNFLESSAGKRDLSTLVDGTMSSMVFGSADDLDTQSTNINTLISALAGMDESAETV